MARLARSGIVRLLKVALPLAALLLIAALFLVGDREDRGGGLGFSGVEFDGEGLRMAQPRFTGLTPDGLPFRVTADWALPDGPDPEHVGLGPLEGQLTLDDGRVATIAADGGDLRPREELLSLRGGVVATLSDGWRVEASGATLDGTAQTLSAAGPVRGAGPSGEIEAASMRAARVGESHYVWFEGGVRVRIDPPAAR